jgi:hypothetical protein
MTTNSKFSELKVQQGIRQAEDDIVKLIQKALDTSTYPRDKLEESQFRNLVRVASETESSEVVKNFLRYQVGRENKWGRGKDSLAEQIINHIDRELKNHAEKIAENAKISDITGILIQLIRRYLGYGARYLKYLKDGNSKSS